MYQLDMGGRWMLRLVNSYCCMFQMGMMSMKFGQFLK
jgi:hypothetical protein